MTDTGGYSSRPPRVLWQSRGVGEDADLAPCQRCGKDVVLDHDPPCPHGLVACPECGHEAVCPQCRVSAETEMFRADVYDPRADPFYTPSAALAPNPAPDPEAVKAARRAGDREARRRYQAWLDSREEGA